MTKNKGLFITFEGIEGSGKSTQIKMLTEHLTQKGIEYLVTKEPGGTDIGYKIRQILLDKNSHFKSKYAELLLFYADRLENVAENIVPAIEVGKVVICDRYIDSSIAYQIGARLMPAKLVASLNKLVGLMPDITLLYDLDPEIGLKRASLRSEKDRFEKEEMTFHHNVRNAYLNQAKIEPSRIKIIEISDLNPEQVFSKTLEKLDIFLK